MRLPLLLLALASASTLPSHAQDPGFRRLPVSQFRDRMVAGWIGQIAGVSFGGPTEFRWQDRIIPEADTPKWNEGMINSAFGQDDLYVEMTFLRTLEEHGLDVSPKQAGIDFANSQYGLWCANRAGRENLRKGIAPPDSGHPAFSRCSDDIDYQIEADYAGLISPGLPNSVIALGDKFGRMMNYGDGLYAGQFMGGMYAEAFFETDLRKVIQAGLACIPAESQYAGMVRDLVRWADENPGDWQKTWALMQDRYSRDPDYHKWASGGIDAKLNGACVLLGLLYGKGDLEQTMAISTRAGWDSDCNPSSSAGVLFTTVGLAKLPDALKSQLNQEAVFSYTAYNFPQLIAVCEKLARQIVLQSGGRIETGADGGEVFLIPVQSPQPGPNERSWEAGPIAGSRYTDEERKLIKFDDELTRAMRTVASGWTLKDCGPDMGAPALLPDHRGRANILITHPLERGVADLLWRKLDVPADKHTHLRLTVGHHEAGDWLLQVKADGKLLLQHPIAKATTDQSGWLDVSVDLTEFAGKTILLELVNQPTDWMCEAAYWEQIAVASE